MSADNDAEVSGPVATINGYIAGSDGRRPISSRTTVTSGWAVSVSVIVRENRSRSTASAAPAGTRCASAARMISEPSLRISSLRRPTALSSLSPRSELEQTSSARPSVLWTSVARTGRISCRVTGTPRDAACHAASEPASPPPMMWITDQCPERCSTPDALKRSRNAGARNEPYAPAALRERPATLAAVPPARRRVVVRRGAGAASRRAVSSSIACW